MVTVRDTYKWRFKHKPYLDASFYPIDPIFLCMIDEASAYHFFNTTDFDGNREETNTTHWQTLSATPWRLRVLEDEILGTLGDGAGIGGGLPPGGHPPWFSWWNQGTIASRRKRQIGNEWNWQFLSYNKVNLFSGYILQY